MSYYGSSITLNVAGTTQAHKLSNVHLVPFAVGTTTLPDFQKIHTEALQRARLFLYTAVHHYRLKDSIVPPPVAAPTFPWVDDVRAIDAANHARAQAHIYGHLADYLRDTSDHETVNRFLGSIDVAEWSPNVLAAILLATAYEKPAFSARPAFFERVAKDLKRRHQYRPAVFDKLK